MLIGLLCAASALGSAQVGPLPGSPNDEGNEPIIITGERVPRQLRDTPSSVVVLRDEEIEAQAGADRLEQLLALIPNVEPGGGNDGPTIRGNDTTGVLREIQSFFGGSRPRVTVQVDGRNTGYFESIFGVAPIWDVAQVEVFRSPQTTTQGRNSIGGAIFVRTADPTYDWEARARGIVGNYDTLQASMLASGPIVADQLAFRAAVDFRRDRPPSQIADLIPDADLNRDEYGLIRLKLLAEPSALPNARLVATYTHQESRAPQIVGVKQPFQQRQADALQFYGVFDNNVETLSGILDYELSSGLTSSTAVSWGDSSVRRRARVGLGQARIEVRDFSIEPILRWNGGGSLSGVGGLHYSRSRLDQFLDITNFFPIFGTASFVDRQSSLGLFGETSLRRGPWRFTGGLRYQQDSQDRIGSVSTARPGYSLDFDETFRAWLPKASVAYQFNDQFNAGLLVQRAYNPGGVTLTIDRGTVDSFDAETLWNYELFVRGSSAGGQINFSANLFYNDITNAQRPQLVSILQPNGVELLFTEIDNAPAAESYGLEVDLRWQVDRSLTLRGGLGLLRTRIIEAQRPGDPLVGNRFQRSPNFSLAAAVDWRPISNARLSAQLRSRGGYFSNDANTVTLRIPGATVLDVRAAYELGPVTLSAYLRNAFNNFYMTLLTSPSLGRAGDPREFGIGIEAGF